ncbi:MAG: ferritin [Vicinamibacterales bacterium]
MANKNVIDAINGQINAELSASYSYLAMSAWCEGRTFTGASRWLRLQSQEEYMHAMKLFDFVLARGGVVQLKAIEQPRGTFASLADVFEKALEQEHEVSRDIDALYELAFREKAFAAVAELQWFLTEQVEEEKTAREIVGKFKLVGSDPASLLDLDRDLGGRVPAETPPATAP